MPRTFHVNTVDGESVNYSFNTVNLFIFAAIHFRVLPMECQFVAINFRISLACLISDGSNKFLWRLIFVKISASQISQK